MTTAQQNQLDTALANYNFFLNKEQSALLDLNKWKTLATNCQKARDAFSLGWKKNNACHIDILSLYNKNWNAAEVTYAAAKIATANQKTIYEAVKAEVYATSNQELATNPDIVLNTQNIEAAQAIEQQKIEDSKAARSTNQKTILYVVGGLIVTAVLVVIVVKIFK